MQPRKIIETFILICLVALILFLIVLKLKNPQGATHPTSNKKTTATRNSADIPNPKIRQLSQRSQKLPPEERVIASVGNDILLKLYGDFTLQLSLPETTETIYIRKDWEIFDPDNPEPFAGIRIKIRNLRGEILTKPVEGEIRITSVYDANNEWYSPRLAPSHIDMPKFFTRANGAVIRHHYTYLKPEIRDSLRLKLSTMISRLDHLDLRSEPGLQFKLCIDPTMIARAFDASGERLKGELFPPQETEWLSGELLFDDE